MIAADAVLIGGGGVAALLVVVPLGLWLWRRRTPPRIDGPEEAVAAVEQMLPGFPVSAAVVGADGLGALAVTADGRIAAVRRVGRRLLAREVPWRVVRATRDGILVETGDRRLGTVLLARVDALDIRRLTPKGIEW
ncbi:hypothetical protein [Sphingomonas abaci]|uniref:Uncharacterized protein n=1 Tax=Sphingomonas abaci TaxID=237611 RepID=A0A7W7AJE7_9SPHN|nr:hypothetical protein [Sphingomonas abaci]